MRRTVTVERGYGEGRAGRRVGGGEGGGGGGRTDQGRKHKTAASLSSITVFTVSARKGGDWRDGQTGKEG